MPDPIDTGMFLEQRSGLEAPRDLITRYPGFEKVAAGDDPLGPGCDSRHCVLDCPARDGHCPY